MASRIKAVQGQGLELRQKPRTSEEYRRPCRGRDGRYRRATPRSRVSRTGCRATRGPRNGAVLRYAPSMRTPSSLQLPERGGRRDADLKNHRLNRNMHPELRVSHGNDDPQLRRSERCLPTQAALRFPDAMNYTPRPETPRAEEARPSPGYRPPRPSRRNPLAARCRGVSRLVRDASRLPRGDVGFAGGCHASEVSPAPRRPPRQLSRPQRQRGASWSAHTRLHAEPPRAPRSL